MVTTWACEFIHVHVCMLLCQCRENRYLLFLTENFAALDILKQYLQDQENKDVSSPPDHDESLAEEGHTRKPWEMEPFILFGSSFPKDKEYTQVGHW